MRFLLSLALLTIAVPAAAQNAPPPPPPMMAPSAPMAPVQEEKPTRMVSVTISPIHLIYPIVEISAEFAITPKIGVAAFGGYGTVPMTTRTTTIRGTTESTERLRAWEIGARFNYYVIGTFDHGMQLGAEVQYLKVARSEANSTQIAASAAGLAIGPYVGYKIITSIGFTFEGNLGVQYVAARGQATDGVNSAEASEKRIIPLLNLNIGWSF